MAEERASSYRFMIQMAINVFLCKKAQDIIGKRVMKEDRPSKTSFLIFFVFATTLFFANQSLYFFFKDNNLYQQIGSPRILTIPELKEWGQHKKYELLEEHPVNLEKIRKFDEALGVLTHPARRLSYDSFGHSGTEYAWAFKSPSFLLSTIISSGVFFVICTVVSLLNKKKSDLREAFKAQIFAMILLFIWEVDLIISTQGRLHSPTQDYLDLFYTSFPLFQRREMLKTIIVPCMGMVQIFVRFYLTSPAEVKILKYASLDTLHPLTLPVRQFLGAPKNDEHLQDRVKAQLVKSRQKNVLRTEIFELQRQNIKLLLELHRQQLVAKQKLGRVINYFVVQ